MSAIAKPSLSYLTGFNQTNDQLSSGDHTERFAYYASVSGNRTSYRLETPVAQVLHDQRNGFGGFDSLIFNPNPKDQFRLVTALRRDFFQVPMTRMPKPPAFAISNANAMLSLTSRGSAPLIANCS
jgi:hypothetical protein